MNQSQHSQNLPSWHTSCAATDINALPVEILAHVFTFCTDRPRNKSFPLNSSPAWLPITRVCRHWRTVALSHPPLWTSITPELSFRWIKIFVERSRTMLMDFDIHIFLYREPNYSKDITLLLSDFTRIRSLRFTGTHHSVFPILDSLCTSLPIQSLSLFLDEYGEKFKHVFF
jgi:hypothetical protein